MRIGLAQICSGRDPEANLALVESAVAEAAAQNVRLLVFPEATMANFAGPVVGLAEPTDGPWADAVRALVPSGMTVVIGMFTPGDDDAEPAGRVRNTLLVTGAGVSAHYDKIHLFDAFGFTESATVQPGSEPVVIDVDGVGVGLATCYDIRFPGLCTALADAGARVIVVPASWGRGPGKVEQWTLLARARALDSTCIIAACDQADPGPAVTGSAPLGVGHSMIVGPDGTVLTSLDSEPGLLVHDLDLEAVDTTRISIPVLLNRRF